MKWSYVLLIYTNDDYGKQGANTIRKYAKATRICFPDEIIVEINPDKPEEHYRNISQRIKSFDGKGIIYFGDGDHGESHFYG